MTEPRAPYWTHAADLDAHVRAEARPQAPRLAPGYPRISDERRRLAAQILERSHGEIIRRLQLPPRCLKDGQRRSVELWDLLEFSVAADGTDFRAESLSDDPDISRCLVSSDLWRPIEPSRWTVAFDPVILPACRELRLDPGTMIGETGKFIRSSMGATFRKYVHWNHLRRAVLEYLAPDPLVFSLTRRIFDDLRPSLESFNWVATHVRELALVAIDRPRMLPFFRYVSCLPGGTPLENLQHVMQAAGMTPSAFRKLECWGHECFSSATSGLVTDVHEVVSRLANLLDRLQVADECPAIFGHIAAWPEFPPAPDWFMRAALGEVLRLEDEDPEDCCPRDLDDAMEWLASTRPDPDGNQRRAGWDWIGAQAWKHRLATDAEAAKPWPVPCEECEIGDFHVIPIRSRVALREEGEKMRNCLSNLADDCASGKIAVFSIREAATRLRVAAFSLEKGESSWRLLQIAGKANAKAPEELKRVALEVAAKSICPDREGVSQALPFPPGRG